jgi:hypothetical protein
MCSPTNALRLAWQLDWKVIAIAGSDEHAKDINDVGDIEKYYPGTVSGIREWFRWYKTPGGALAAPASPEPALGRTGGWVEGVVHVESHACARQPLTRLPDSSSARPSSARLLVSPVVPSEVTHALTRAASLSPPCPHFRRARSQAIRSTASATTRRRSTRPRRSRSSRSPTNSTST